MNLPLKIARRYLFARKSTNAINIITGIAVFGIAVGAMVLVLVLSVFNGFEEVITAMYSNFNPDVRITPRQGKSFAVDSTLLAQLQAIDGVAYVSQTLEEVAFFEHRENQDFGILKGVDDNFRRVTGIDSTIREGEYTFAMGTLPTAVLGLGMRIKLNVNRDELITAFPINVYMPKREGAGLFGQPFRRQVIYPAGSFVIQQEYDNQYVLCSLDFARRLLGFDDEVSSLELQLYPGFDTPATLAAIQQLMGPAFDVKNRYQQQETFMRLMKIEKWLSYAIVSLMLLLVSFNIIGALWMIVLEKQPDIAILKSMGAHSNTVRNIFLYEGLLLCTLGIGAGFLLAISIYWVQVNYGLITMPGNLIIDAYPVEMRPGDFLVVAVTVLAIGMLAAIPPALRARRVPAIIREE